MEPSLRRLIVVATLGVGLLAGGFTWLRLEQNQKGLDFTERLPRAIDAARDRVPDAELSGAEVSYVDSEGRVELPISLALQDRRAPPASAPPEGITFRFRSASREASRGQVPPSLGRPVAAGAEASSCVLTVQTRQTNSLWASDSLRVHELPGADCGRSSVAPIKCTLAQVWAKALKQGAPMGALAQIGLHLDADDHWVWHFEVFDWSKGPRGLNAPQFSITLLDACDFAK